MFLTDTDRASFPVAAESGRFAELQAAVTELAAGRAILAGTIADSQAWLFILYTDRTDWLAGFESEFRSRASDHQVGLAVAADKAWRAYQSLTPKVYSPAQRLAGLALTTLILPLGAGRYGPAWYAAGLVAVLIWVVALTLSRKRVAAGQLAHPGIAFCCACYVLATLFFGLVALLAHPSSPWRCVEIGAALGVVVAAACWPSQRKYYARMRARAQLQPGSEPASPS